MGMMGDRGRQVRRRRGQTPIGARARHAGPYHFRTSDSHGLPRHVAVMTRVLRPNAALRQTALDRRGARARSPISCHEPAARPPLRLSCAPRVPHPARALPFRVLVLDTIVCLIHHSSMRAGSRVPRRRQYIEVRFLLHSHPVASVFSCACMMHLIFRVGNERLISFHTPPVARHHDMYVVHTTLLSEAPRRAYDFRRHRRPDWVQR